MKASRITALVLGALLTFPAIGLLFGGGALSVIYGTQRDDAGFFNVTPDPLVTQAYAITAEKLDLGTSPGPPEWVVDNFASTIRLQVDGGDTAMFVGIAAQTDLDAYLANVAHDEIDEVTGLDWDITYRRVEGTDAPASPADQTFWVAQAAGAGPQELVWETEAGEWAVIVMNADASAPVTAEVTAGLKAPVILPVGIALIFGGAVLMAVAVLLIVWGGRGRRVEELEAAPEAPARREEELAPLPEPVRLAARLDDNLSPWKWLVKWFLAIPHLIVLAFLWAAFVVLTVFAGIAILFTGRYPRGIFDFNVGVLRWTWRVSYYAFSGGLGTDRYPPFTLAVEPLYPATLDVEYPQELSRGLVLVKWWLLAIPHYLVLAPIAGWWATTTGGDPFWSGGLLTVLVVVAAVILLFTERYPKPLFDLVIGLNRWVYRVVAYAALMTDHYPPFRLDQGGSEPHTLGEPPRPSPADARQTSLSG